MTIPVCKTVFSKGASVKPIKKAVTQHSDEYANEDKQEIKEANPFEMHLYDAHTIHNYVWPQTEDGEYAKSFILSLMQEGVPSYIRNIQTNIKVLVWKNIFLPITINEAEYDNAYVCSPYSFYVSYAKQSLKQITQVWARPFVHTLLQGFSKLFHYSQFNRVVIVNNWLLSTNLYPSLTVEEIKKIAQFLQKSFPHHTIIFRSLDLLTNPTYLPALESIGYDLIASREIFITDPQKTELFESRLFKSDLRLLKNSGYEIIEESEIEEIDLPRILSLYQDLYISKHSTLNPQWTLKFIELAWKKKLFQFRVLKKEGRIDGVVGIVNRNGIMLCPFLGYDLEQPKEAALYRLLSTVLMLEARKQKLIFHQSSGASMFKRIRKAVSSIEYTAVYCKNLSIKRKIPWRILKKVCNSIGVFYMKRY